MRLLSIIRRNCSQFRPDIYLQRKHTKKLLKYANCYTLPLGSTLQREVDMKCLVPQFFVNSLPIYYLPMCYVPDRNFNHFTNSYVRVHLPLAYQPELRDKLNKLYDKYVRIGRLLEIMDSVAGVVSYKHCFGSISSANPMTIVTGSVYSYNLYDPITINYDINIEGYLNYVGKTSLYVYINIWQSYHLKSHALFVMVSRDSNDLSKGYVVPSMSFELLDETDRLKAEGRLKEAQYNLIKRKIYMAYSYDNKPPSYAYIQYIHDMFLSRRRPDITPFNSIGIGKTVITHHSLMHTQLRNVHNKIFGGYLMREMLELAWLLGSRYTGSYVQIEDLTNIYFKKAVEIGTHLSLKAQVTYVELNRIVVTVYASTSIFTESKYALACYLHIVLRVNSHPLPVHPESYEEALQYLSSRKAFQDLFY